VTVWYVSANRDEAVFPDPTASTSRGRRTTTSRSASARTTAWAQTLAQLEARLFFAELFSRFPEIEPAGPPVRMRGNHFIGIKHLPVRPGPRAR